MYQRKAQMSCVQSRILATALPKIKNKKKLITNINMIDVISLWASRP